jgi:hypothetical protein
VTTLFRFGKKVYSPIIKYAMSITFFPSSSSRPFATSTG